MRVLKYLFIINLIICPSLRCYSQSSANYILHVIDTSYHNNDDSFVVKHKILIKSGNCYSEVLSILNYSEDFYFVCYYIDNDDCTYFVFSNYGSSAGISKVYFINPKLKSIFESSSLFEFEIPIYNSFTKDSLEVKLVSFKDGDCGVIKGKKVDLYQNSEQLIQYRIIPENYIKKLELLFE